MEGYPSVIRINVLDLKVGDEFWNDQIVDQGETSRIVYQTSCYYVVTEEPVKYERQIGNGMADVTETMVRVAVQFIDGGYGTREFDLDTDITVRRAA
jgi:hypothetical protein